MIPADFSLRTVRDLFAQISSALQEGAEIEIDCSALATIDLAGIQLLVSAARSAQAAGKRLFLQPPCDILEAALARAGIAAAQLPDSIFINRA